MCGRFTQMLSWPEVHQLSLFRIPEGWETTEPEGYGPAYNIAPTQQIAVARQTPDGGEVRLMRWGLIPSWWKEPKPPPSTFNARGETVASRPMFRSAYKRQRALIPASGFYEWRKESGGKVPHYITRMDGQGFCFAGLWEWWKEPSTGNEVLSATIITTAPNAMMAELHNRMPVILEPEERAVWLAPDVKPESLAELLAPRDWPGMHHYAVSTAVNFGKNQGPALVEPVG